MRCAGCGAGQQRCCFFGLALGDQNVGKPRLMGISKRGSEYLRKLLIHGARAALPHVAERDTALGRWAKDLLARVHPNVAVVALANKMARICWALLRHGQHFAAKGAPLAA